MNKKPSQHHLISHNFTDIEIKTQNTHNCLLKQISLFMLKC